MLETGAAGTSRGRKATCLSIAGMGGVASRLRGSRRLRCVEPPVRPPAGWGKAVQAAPGMGQGSAILLTGWRGATLTGGVPAGWQHGGEWLAGRLNWGGFSKIILQCDANNRS